MSATDNEKLILAFFSSFAVFYTTNIKGGLFFLYFEQPFVHLFLLVTTLGAQQCNNETEFQGVKFTPREKTATCERLSVKFTPRENHAA